MMQQKASWLLLKPGLRAWLSCELRSLDAQIAYLLPEVVCTRKGCWRPLE